MPLITISLSKSWSREDQKLIADGIHEAIVGVGFPQTDRFQKIHRLSKDQFLYDERHPNLTEPRTKKFVLIGLRNPRPLGVVRGNRFYQIACSWYLQ